MIVFVDHHLKHISFLTALFDTNNDVPWNSWLTGSNHTLKCPSNQWEDPPYRTKAVYRYDGNDKRAARISDRTMCMSVRQGEIDIKTGQPKYRHYDVHRYESVAFTRIEDIKL